MEKYHRPITETLKRRLNETVHRIILLAGPRQVGKTTAVNQVLSARGRDSYAFYAVDSPESSGLRGGFNVSNASTSYAEPVLKDAQWLVNCWQLARESASRLEQLQQRQQAQPYVLVLDEIQKIKNWASVVKGLWDADRLAQTPMHVVILGSAPLLLQKGSSESLAGRFELIKVTHWSYLEMQQAFDFTLNEFIYFGGYPGPAKQGLIRQEERWRDYVQYALIQPNIDKDILALARVEKPALMRQLFELASSYSGQIMALTKLVAQLQDAGNTTTLTDYLQLLHHAGLIAGLSKYSAHKVRQRASAPKLNVLNTAFQAVYSDLSFQQAQADKRFWGRMVESAVGAHLLNTATPNLTLSYWRESPLEVDFVLHSGSKLCAIEVKSSSKIGGLKGLGAFIKLNPNAKTLLVGGSDASLASALSLPAPQWLDAGEL